MSVAWFRTLADLRALGDEYDRFVLSTRPEGMFYTVGWLERSWRYHQSRLGGSLAIAVAFRSSEIVGVAPFSLREKSWTHARQKLLGFVGGTSDELDTWVPTFFFREAAALDELAAAIAVARWDLLELRLVVEGSVTEHVLRARIPGITAEPDPLATPRVVLADGFAPYRAKWSKRLTRMLDRGAKRAKEDAALIDHTVTAMVPAELRAEAEALHRARQDSIRARGRARHCPFDDAEGRAVFWGLIDWAASRGHLRAHWLRIGGRIAAYVIAMHHAGTTWAWFNAIDPEAEKYHPGSLILAEMIEREAAAGARVVDLMVGANLTKLLFATEEVRHVGLRAIHPTSKRARVKNAWIEGAKVLRARISSR